MLRGSMAWCGEQWCWSRDPAVQEESCSVFRSPSQNRNTNTEDLLLSNAAELPCCQQQPGEREEKEREECESLRMAFTLPRQTHVRDDL